MEDDQGNAGKEQAFFVYTTCPVKKRRDKESGKQNNSFLSRKYIRHYPVKGNGAKKRNKGIEDHIYIVKTKTENVEYRKDFNEHVCFKVVPIRIFGTEKTF